MDDAGALGLLFVVLVVFGFIFWKIYEYESKREKRIKDKKMSNERFAEKDDVLINKQKTPDRIKPDDDNITIKDDHPAVKTKETKGDSCAFKHNVSAAEVFLLNPFYILGLPCNSERIDILKAHEKILKLSKIGAEKTYKTNFEFEGIQKPTRDTGTVQSAMKSNEEPINKLFWFSSDKYVKMYGDHGPIEFFNNGYFDEVEFDCFLFNYFYLLVNDPGLLKTLYWNRLFEYIVYFINLEDEKAKELLYNKLSAGELSDKPDYPEEFLQFSKQKLLHPLFIMVQYDLSIKEQTVLFKLVRSYKTKIFTELKEKLANQMLDWLTIEVNKTTEFFKKIPDRNNPSKNEINEAIELANELLTETRPNLDLALESVGNYGSYANIMKDFFFDKLNSLSDFFITARNYKNSAKIIKGLKNYVSPNNENEFREAIEFANYIEKALKNISELRASGDLDSEDERIVKHKDPQICILALRAFGNDPESQLLLGMIYREYQTTIDMPYSRKKGLFWITRSAKNGSPKAQLILSSIYFSGEGVTKDLIKADYWLKKAAESGDEEAKSTLSMLQRDYRYNLMLSESINSTTRTTSASGGGCLVSYFTFILFTLFFVLLFV